jgi:peptidoglycan/LPS O-acetylase OafA/YrhL
MKLETDLARVSLGERLEATFGRPSGFDYLRLGLAVSIVVVHSHVLTFGLPSNVSNSIELLIGAPLPHFHPLISAILVIVHGTLVAAHKAILPMFFALSGFLVAGSLERSNIRPCSSFLACA